MKLVIGGRAQGKLNYVLENMAGTSYKVYEGVLPDKKEIHAVKANGNTLIVNHFHNWVNNKLREDKKPEVELKAFVAEDMDCIIISDEVGNGIVPIDAFERDYRERTGRMLTTLANEADEVVRVLCGIGQKIK